MELVNFGIGAGLAKVGIEMATSGKFYDFVFETKSIFVNQFV
jgi:hypothetical protein